MKAFLTTDWHFGIYPLKYDIWLKMMVNYFDNFFIPLLKKNVKEGDILIHLGDLYDNRNNIPIDVMNEVERIMIEISEILPIHIIIGNHDIFNKSTNYINSPKSLRWIPNINLYEETKLIKIGDKELLMMPWVEHKNEQIELLKKYSGSDYLFCHSDLNGCRMHLSSVAWKNKNKIDIEDFSSYGHCFSGHIHIRQVNKNFTFIGAPYQMDRNDYNDRKGVYILDINSGVTKFIENDYSPEFIKVSIIKSEDIDKLLNINTNKNYVDLEISNSLLMNDREIRKKIDNVLRTGKFASVKYINDIIKDDVSLSDEDVDDELIDIDILDDIELNDLESLILKYIKMKKYSDDNIKEEVIAEYQKILTIYNDEYKFK